MAQLTEIHLVVPNLVGPNHYFKTLPAYLKHLADWKEETAVKMKSVTGKGSADAMSDDS